MTSLIFTEGSQGTLCSTDALPPVGKCLGGTCLFSGERDEDMNIYSWGNSRCVEEGHARHAQQGGSLHDRAPV